MIVDDRLDTVLRTVATGQAAARTQYRQLVDLLGRAPAGETTPTRSAALERLDSLDQWIGERERAAILERAAIRSPGLVDHFARATPRLAAGALRGARLSEEAWLELIPALPVAARGFLRHRRDLGPEVERLLARFGIGDTALPLPDGYEALVLTAKDAEAEAATPRDGIGAIVQRIEAFRRHRETAAHHDGPGAEAPRLPFEGEEHAPAPLTAIDIACDATGTIVSAEGAVAAMVVGHCPFTDDPAAPARCDRRTLRAVRERRPVREGRVELDGAPAIAGPWRIDAVPRFAPQTGRFTGWQARLRRPALTETPRPAHAANDDDRDSADRLRQMLHELRTPINAIQGFAEMIQQQVIGTIGHQYRSYAAHIAGDAARILAGFDEVDRLVKLETGRIACERGETDGGDVVRKVLAQVEPLFTNREVRLRVTLGDAALPIGIEANDFEALVWRLFSIVAATAAPGERLSIDLADDPHELRLAATLPAALAAQAGADLFAPTGKGAEALPTSLLGSGFALRLVAAEARSAGGNLVRSGNLITLSIPLLTADSRAPSEGGGAG